MSEERKINGINEFLQISMTNNMPLSVNEKRQIFELIINLQTQLQQKENIIKKLEEFIEREIELYTIELIEENTNKLSIVAPIKGVYKEIYNVLQELKDSDKK